MLYHLPVSFNPVVPTVLRVILQRALPSIHIEFRKLLTVDKLPSPFESFIGVDESVLLAKAALEGTLAPRKYDTGPDCTEVADIIFTRRNR